MIAIARVYAESVGLNLDWSDRTPTVSKLAVISQVPKESDCPEIPWPPVFHYTGPFHGDQGREAVPFAWDWLNESPLVYASLGTLLNGLLEIHRTLISATARLSDLQFVFSIGENTDPGTLGPIPPNMLIVPVAPQIELLKRAALCIKRV